jgi:hypothetical protein
VSEPARDRRRVFTRRRFIAAGAGAVGVAAAAVYAPLAVGGGFERLVAERLGVEEELATRLLERAREHYGDTEYDARAALFALAYRGPSSLVVPDSLRRSTAEALVGPMLDTPAANLAYAMPDRDPSRDSCLGLVRDR